VLDAKGALAALGGGGGGAKVPWWKKVVAFVWAFLLWLLARFTLRCPCASWRPPAWASWAGCCWRRGLLLPAVDRPGQPPGVRHALHSDAGLGRCPFRARAPSTRSSTARSSRPVRLHRLRAPAGRAPSPGSPWAGRRCC
jgi:hypothetical protein